MFDIQNYGSFIMTVIVFQLIPGAGTITILKSSAQGGIGGGMKAVCGTLIGDFIYMLAAVLGLAALLGAYPGVLAGAQWIGVGYLCWLGWKLLRTSVTNPAVDKTLDQGGWPYFRQALAVSLTNPKVIAFFMAFFPLFLRPESKPVTLLVLMIHVTVISFVYQTGLVLVGNTVARRLSKWHYAKLVATHLAGVAFIAFGVKLALGNR